MTELAGVVADRMRARQLDAMPQRCLHRRATPGPRDAGGAATVVLAPVPHPVPSWVPEGGRRWHPDGALPCRLARVVTPLPTLTDGRLSPQTIWLLTLPAGFGGARGDVVEVVGRGSYELVERGATSPAETAEQWTVTEWSP